MWQFVPILDLALLSSGAGGGVIAPPDPSALAAPSLGIEALPESATERQVLVRVAGPTSWPIDARVQLYTRRQPSLVWIATGTPVLAEATLTYTREVDPFTMEISGIAVTEDGDPAPSERSAVMTATVSGLDTVGVPLSARVQVIAGGQTGAQTLDLTRPAAILHGDSSPNVLLVDRTVDAESSSAVTLTAVLWRLEDRTTRRVLASGAASIVLGAWRTVIRHPGGTGIVLVVELVPSVGARTRLRFATSWTAR